MESGNTARLSIETDQHSVKRKRSLSTDIIPPIAPPAKIAKTHSGHLQINYLARQCSDPLPLITTEDSLPSLLSLIADYDGILQRHESMAGNLGARPLGPILIKRFERLFDGPPVVLKTHGKGGTTVTWLDVVEFARHKPEQFNMEKMRDGVRVCQFYTKQSRVEITEEDYLLIASGMPQKLIPPQPIAEDEEKELGTLEILEKNLGQIVQLADQVSARARQLNHRMKNRKSAIISRREAEAEDLPTTRTEREGEQPTSISPTSGFIAVNSRSFEGTTNGCSTNESSKASRPPRGIPHAASAATRAELLSKFYTNNERLAVADDDSLTKAASVAMSKPKSRLSDGNEHPFASASPAPIPNTSSGPATQTKSSAADRFDDSGPFKADMMARMEQMQRGDRVQPPCDRCRRLHMDCLKNMTACQGCTKKHSKCSWKDVKEQELIDHPLVLRSKDDMEYEANGYQDAPSEARQKDFNELKGLPVRDEELLGEDSDEGDIIQTQETVTNQAPTASMGKGPSEVVFPEEGNDQAESVLLVLPEPERELDLNLNLNLANPSDGIAAKNDHAPTLPRLDEDEDPKVPNHAKPLQDDSWAEQKTLLRTQNDASRHMTSMHLEDTRPPLDKPYTTSDTMKI